MAIPLCHCRIVLAILSVFWIVITPSAIPINPSSDIGEVGIAPSLDAQATIMTTALSFYESDDEPITSRPLRVTSERGIKSKFLLIEIAGNCSEALFADLDGNGLKDILLLDGIKIAIFFQKPKAGFNKEPDQIFNAGDNPFIVWTSRLTKKSDSLLILDSQGMYELTFSGGTNPPIRSRIIAQPTIIPERLEKPFSGCFPLTAETKTNFHLIMVPSFHGLQVWKYGSNWQKTQTLTNAFDLNMLPSIRNPGYVHLAQFDFGLNDLDRDGRSDLMFRQDCSNGMKLYSTFLQNDTGIFGPIEAMRYESLPDQRDWLCWIDLNRDGRVDLIKSTWLEHPWFLPGSKSGKAVVGVYYADKTGKIPEQPQQVLRKNDSMSALPVVDVDGDGFVDLMLGSAPFDSREDVRRMFMTRKANLNLGFLFYRPGTGFPKEPDCQAGVMIQVDEYALFPVRSLREHFEQYVNLRGDFNGDGKRDLLVRERNDRISVRFFISRQKGFSGNENLRFDSPESIEWFKIDELNGDNISDVIIKYRKRKALCVFLSSTP